MAKSLYIGRFQPLHGAHIKIINRLLEEDREVVIGIRTTYKQTKDNPYNFHQRYNMIRRVFPDESKVEIIPLPDITEVVYGRTPGWKLREIVLEEGHQHVSATKLRGGFLIWLTGNSGSGKTELANELRHWFPSLINLDGDEMRHTISTEEGFSYDDRKGHNERVARLAGLLRDQGHIVVVSVICPYQDIRGSVEEIAGPVHWVFIDRPSNDWLADEKRAGRGYRPYEKPTDESYIYVDSDINSPQRNAEIVFNKIMKRL